MLAGVAANSVALTLFLDSVEGNCSWELSRDTYNSLISYSILTSVQVDANNSLYMEIATLKSSSRPSVPLTTC